MYKILLVDDEEMVIKSLKATVKWEDYGFEIVDYATSANEAYEKVETLHPDVVFTDIRMPQISGLELLQMIKAINPGIYCVVISGYAEFAYIQKSVRLEAVGYCLKPFDPDEIGMYLKRIKKSLDETGIANNPQSRILEYMQSTSVEALAYMNDYYKEQGIDFEKEKLRVMYTIGVDKMDHSKTRFSVSAGYQKNIYLINEAELDEIMKTNVGKAEALLNALHIGISDPIQSLEKVARAIRRAKRCAYQFFCQEDCEVVVTVSDSTKELSLLRILEKALENNDTGRVNKCILEITDKFIVGEYNMEDAIHLRNIFVTRLTENGQNEETDLVLEYDALCEIYQSVYDMLLQLENEYYKRNSDTKNQFQSDVSNKTFKTIFRFLENNYTKQINIAELSEEFHINACYFSQLFKKEMGCTFTEYLSKKRIDYACKLLRETNLKVSEIAEMSGFSDYFYFSRVFRKLKQCSPTDYRIE